MEGAEVISFSKSKKSVILQTGALDGLKEGQRALFYIAKHNKDKDHPSFIRQGLAEVIKVRNSFSYWIFHILEPSTSFKKHQWVVFIRDSVLGGKKKIQATKTDIIGGNGGVNIPNRYIFKRENYKEVVDLIELEFVDQNINIRTHGGWNRLSKSFDKKFLQDIDELSIDKKKVDFDLEELVTENTIDVFVRQVDGSVQKINQLEYGLKNDLYKKTEEYATKDYEKGFYARSLQKQSEYNRIDPAYIRRIVRHGSRWSEGMTDKQLREFLIDSGLAREIRRRNRVLNQKAGDNFNFSFETKVYNDNYENFKANSFFVGYEHMLGWLFELDSFSISLQLAIGFANGNFSDRDNSSTASRKSEFLVSWYPIRSPHMIKTLIPIFSLGYGEGRLNVKMPNISRKYTYRAKSLPIIKAGLRYRFKAGDTRDELVKMGMGATFFIKKEFNQLKVLDFLRDNINDKIEQNPWSINIAWNLYY